MEALLRAELARQGGHLVATSKALHCNRITVVRYINKFKLNDYAARLRDLKNHVEHKELTHE